MEEIVAQWEQEANATLPPHDITVRYYVNSCLGHMEKQIRENTLESYRSYARNHIIPILGDTPMTELSWRVIQEFVDELSETHSVESIRKYCVLLRKAIEEARRDGIIESNPMELVEYPKGEKFIPYPYDKDVVGKIFALTKTLKEPMRAAIVLALCYGMRRSEVSGLRWEDIDLEANTIHIQHTHVQNGKVDLDEKHTKTKRSNRVLVLIPETIPYFKSLRELQISMGIKSDKVVALLNGEKLRPDGIYTRFKTFLDKYGFDPKIRFHDLRHFSGSMLADAGIPLKQIQAFLGHDYNSPITARVYLHEERKSGEKTAAMMGEILKDLPAA